MYLVRMGAESWHGHLAGEYSVLFVAGRMPVIGGALARQARAGHPFLTIPHLCLFLPPSHQTIWSTFSPCPILCTQFMTMARVVVGSGRSDILCC